MRRGNHHPSRRSVLAALGAGAGLLTLPGIGRAGSKRRVLILGSSQIRGAPGKYLANRLRDQGHEVQRKAKSASGLSRSDYFNWFSEARTQYDEFQPDLTVVLFGGNDAQGIRMGQEADPPWIRWKDEGWKEEYTVRVRGFAEIVTAGGEELCWLGMPIVKPNGLRGRMKRLNRIYRSVMGEQSNWHYVDTWPFMTDGKGHYLASIEDHGEPVPLRASDGVHMTIRGARRFVDRVEPEVKALL